MRNYFKQRYIQYIILLFILLVSCDKDKYEGIFYPPETTPIELAIKTATSIGYASSVAMSSISGNSPANASISRSSSGYPCTATIYVDVNSSYNAPFTNDYGELVIAGYFIDQYTAILTVLFTDINVTAGSIVLYNIHTFPVTIDNDIITSVYASQDINFREENDTMLSIDLTTGEIDTELARLQLSAANDIYIAVEQDAWIIETNQDNTPNITADDDYMITGGGQLAKITSNTGGIYQQALLDCKVNSTCNRNPTSGYALLQDTKAGENDIKLGQALMRFHNSCDGKIYIEAATGNYVTYSGKTIDINLQ